MNNMTIVNDGKKDIATNYIKTNYTTIKVGNGGDDTASSQTDLDSVLFTKTGQTPNIVANSLNWSIDITGANLGTQGISELGIFHKDNDTLLSRTSFSNTGVVPSGDTITFKIKLEVN